MTYDLPSGGAAPGDRGLYCGGRRTGNVKHNVIQYITISTLGDSINFGDLTAVRSLAGGASNGVNDKGVTLGGLNQTAYVNIIDTMNISYTGNATDFGDMLAITGQGSTASNGTNNRAINGGGWTTDAINVISYICISIKDNATDFGDLMNQQRGTAGMSNDVNDRAVWAGGYTLAGSRLDLMQYVTISTTGNAADFGYDLTIARSSVVGIDNGTNERGLITGGYETVATTVDTIEYITINTPSDSIDFGDLTFARYYHECVSNRTNERACIAGGNGYSNVIEYVTISTTGNALDFGDLIDTVSAANGLSNS